MKKQSVEELEAKIKSGNVYVSTVPANICMHLRINNLCVICKKICNMRVTSK